MAEPTQGVDDEEIRMSLHTIQADRSRKRVIVLVGLVLAIVALFGAVVVSYSDTSDSAKPSATPEK